MLTAALGLGLVNCSAIVPFEAHCRPGEFAAVMDTLYFGTEMAHGVVSEADWASFVATEVSTRLSEGFTFWKASGEWRSPLGAPTAEPVYVLQVAHSDSETFDQQLSRIQQSYKVMFHQQSVLRVRTPACVLR